LAQVSEGTKKLMHAMIHILAMLALPVAAFGGFVGFIYACSALNQMRHTSGEQRGLALLLAIHAGEPVVTVVWMIARFFAESRVPSNPTDSALLAALASTAPMILLLTPVVGLWWRDADCRTAAVGTLMLGILRWAGSVSFLVLYSRDGIGRGALGGTEVVAVIGTGLLWFCIVRVHRLLVKQRLIVAGTAP
jgi:hypothetical protein